MVGEWLALSAVIILPKNDGYWVMSQLIHLMGSTVNRGSPNLPD